MWLTVIEQIKELKMVESMAVVASFILPLFNIPLIVGIERRKSSKDISLVWAVGVWVCFAVMLPAALISPDAVFRLFGIINIIGFTAVMVQVVRYR